MKAVPMIVTSDGAQHTSVERATRHAEQRYGDALSRLAHRLIQCDKYGVMQAFIDETLDQFVALKALKDDITLEQSGEDE